MGRPAERGRAVTYTEWREKQNESKRGAEGRRRRSKGGTELRVPANIEVTPAYTMGNTDVYPEY